MSEIDITNAGLSSTVVKSARTTLRRGWDVLRSMQFNKKASIIRYTETDSGHPDVGIPPSKEQVTGLSNLDVLVGSVSLKEVNASNGVLQQGDKKMVFLKK